MRRLAFEMLEGRRLLANLSITHAFLLDNQDNRTDAPSEGFSSLRVEFQAHDLAAGSTYTVRRCLDGTCTDATLNWYAGLSGVRTAIATWGKWWISPGNHTVQVTVDALNGIVESSESDNTYSFSFNAPNTPDPLFLNPLGGTPFKDWQLGNYVDLDPSSGIRDYRGRAYSYDGHNGHDYGLAGFEKQDSGVPIYAAATGRVVIQTDGGGDRCGDPIDYDCGHDNHVVIDHGAGWQTQYLHMRKGSVAVSLGEVVAAGQLIGFVGSSGNSTGPHLHWGVYHGGSLIEPYVNPSLHLLEPLAYSGDTPGLIDFAIGTSNPPANHRIAEREVLFPGETPQIWMAITTFNSGTKEEVIWYRSDGSEHARLANVLASDVGGGIRQWSTALSDDLGMWQVVATINDVEVARSSFLRTHELLPKVKVSGSASNYSVIQDGSTAPVVFDAVSPGKPGSVRTITVRNVGNDTLTLGPLIVPAGFSAIEGLSSSIAPGEYDTFTLRLDTTNVGLKTGTVTFSTNDSDAGQFDFAVEGLVTSLSVSVASANIVENASGVATIGTVSRENVGLERDMRIFLTSSDPSEATIPSVVTIPVGQSSVSFDIMARDDVVLDGSQQVTITASVFGNVHASTNLTVADHESLIVAISETAVAEGGGHSAGSIIVTRSNAGNVALPLLVTLSSSDITEATVPATVTIPSGQASVTVNLGAVDDAIVDGTQTVSITATATGFTSGSDTVDVTDNDSAALTVNVLAASIAENAGAAATTVTITRNTSTAAALTVNLISSDTSEAAVPATATIPAGQHSVTVNLDAVDDAIVDGTQTVTITAAATGFTSGSDTVDVTDNENPALSVNILATSVAENAGAAATTVTVTRNTSTATALTVNLSGNDTSEATVPATVAIPAGQSSATVDLNAVDDAVVDGTQTVTITAAATGFSSGSDTVDVTDNEVATLTVNVLATSIAENAGVAATTVTITRNTSTTTALTVNLSSSDTSEATVPATATIPSGQASVTVNLGAVDDAIVDGTLTVSITATATGFTSGSDTVDVTDNDSSTLTVNVVATLIAENAEAAATTIPAGQSSVTVDLNAVDDAVVDGTQTVTITAAATGFTSGSDTVAVTDNEDPALSVNILATSIAENAGAAATTVTITRNTSTTTTLTVNLSSSDISEATVPATATIPAGQDSVTVNLDAVDDLVVDGTQTVTITAAANEFTSGSDAVDVTDNESPSLNVNAEATSIAENAGTAATTVTITRNTSTATPLTVNLTSSDTSEATLPATVTIPAGLASISANLDAVDDALLDGTQLVTITATATGYAAGSISVLVTDVNKSPTAHGQTVTTNEDTLVLITLSGDDGDDEGDQGLVYIVTSLPTHGALSYAADGAAITAADLPLTLPGNSLYYTPDANDVESRTFAFAVRDGGGTADGGEDSSDESRVTVMIIPINDPPILRNPAHWTLDEGTTLTFTLDAADVDIFENANDTVSYSTASGQKDGMTLNSATGEFSWTPTEVYDGKHVVVFQAADNHGAKSERQSVTITVNEVNDPPVLDNPGDLSVTELQRLEVALSARDGDFVEGAANAIVFSIVIGAQVGMSLDTASGVFGWTPHAKQAGEYSLEFGVSDGHGGVDEQAIKITVHESNHSPTNITVSNLTVDENTAGGSIGDLVVSDPDIDQTHSLVLSDERFEVVDGKLKLKSDVSLDFEAASSLTIGITVTDSGSPALSATKSFSISVNDVNDPPTSIALSNTTIKENLSGATIGTLSAADQDGGQTHTFTTTDPRFEILNGVLKLKEGQWADGTSVAVDVVATDSGDPPQALTQTLEIHLMPNPRAWRNESLPFDTNGDGSVVALDALRVINELKDPKIHGFGGKLPDHRSATASLPFYDTNGDGFCTAVGDVLPIINFLNSQSAAEGESMGQPSMGLIRPIILDAAQRFGSIDSSSVVLRRFARPTPFPTMVPFTPNPQSGDAATQDRSRCDPERRTKNEQELESAIDAILSEIADDVTQALCR